MMKPKFMPALKRLRREHNEKGTAIVTLCGALTLDELNEPGVVIVNLTDEAFRFDGPTILRRPLGKWVFENAKRRAFTRERAVLWSTVDEEGRAVVGVGALTDTAVAQRMMEKGSSCEMLEVC